MSSEQNDPICTAIRWFGNRLEVLDQLLLPLQSLYISVKNTEDGWSVINKMQVRGAPAIAIVGCLSLAAEIQLVPFSNIQEVDKHLKIKLDYLITSRPTAVNMRNAAEKLSAYSACIVKTDISVEEMKLLIIKWCEKLLADDLETNRNLGEFGATHILQGKGDMKVRLLTHCNTGSLATAGYGTALGVVRSIHSLGKLEQIYCTETRPYNQGARLTAYELVQEKMPATLICDSMAAALMNNCSTSIDAIIVGVDRVACNGDSANKIGTYQLAVLAKHHHVPFYVCAPTTSIDLTISTGNDIPIELRPDSEMTQVAGVTIAAPGIKCWNPAFDVTPAELITGGIVTEKGVFQPSELHKFV